MIFVDRMESPLSTKNFEMIFFMELKHLMWNGCVFWELFGAQGLLKLRQNKSFTFGK